MAFEVQEVKEGTPRRACPSSSVVGRRSSLSSLVVRGGRLAGQGRGWRAGWLDGWMAGWLDGWMATYYRYLALTMILLTAHMTPIVHALHSGVHAYIHTYPSYYDTIYLPTYGTDKVPNLCPWPVDSSRWRNSGTRTHGKASKAAKSGRHCELDKTRFPI
ncbi:hypothetical protein IAQ61_001852 [Plenodomus lingam]|uniref:uncharacterized protein n=1 Tax=Leptosphaeria maculans TaxID=5022 RepID=UPI0033179E82|nr:hypothetical protein IAQ61_001852 [Plenodomus lingam]